MRTQLGVTLTRYKHAVAKYSLRTTLSLSVCWSLCWCVDNVPHVCAPRGSANVLIHLCTCRRRSSFVVVFIVTKTIRAPHTIRPCINTAYTPFGRGYCERTHSTRSLLLLLYYAVHTTSVQSGQRDASAMRTRKHHTTMTQKNRQRALLRGQPATAESPHPTDVRA